MLVDRIAEQTNTLRSKGWKSYLDHVRAMAEGREPPIDKIVSCLESVGKGPLDFDKDVETIKKRIQSFDALTNRDEYRLTGPTLYADYQALRVAAKESAKQFDEQIKQAFFASNAAADGLRHAEEAEKYLRDSCLDLSLHAKKKEIQSRWESTHNRLMKSNDERRNQESINRMSSDELDRMKRSSSHPSDIVRFENAIPIQQKILADMQERFDAVQAELTAINEELDSVHSQMMQP